MTQYPLVCVGVPHAGWSLEDFSAAVGLHPQLVRRFVALGLLLPERHGSGGQLWFGTAQVARAARIQRLRVGLGLNYAAVGVVLELLTRIEELEAALRARPTTAWPSTGTATDEVNGWR
ncbi:MAG: chaperone modulator CbpM [Actinomycetota bacterium]|nr:chaperone modulator CbpM [Actinomycetota bacterium]